MIDGTGPLLLIGAAVGAVIGVPTAVTMATPQPAAVEAIADTPIVEGDEGEAGADGGRTIRRAADGLFYADVRINGGGRRCLIDSGATGLVLDAGDARRLAPGSRPRFTGRVTGATGSRAAARTRLARVTIAGRELRDVPAILVATGPGPATPCLIGQSVLARLDLVELRGDRLVLR